MNNCLVTTLKASTGNKSLLKVGEMVIDVKEMSSPTNNTNKLVLNNGGISDFSLEVENGEANLTLDSNMSSGWSSTLVLPKKNAEQTVYFRNGNYRVKMISKYNIISYKTDSAKTAICVDVKNLQFSSKVTNITGQIKGDIKNLSALTSITTLYCVNNSNVSGEIADIKNLTQLSNLRLLGDYSGDIASLNLINPPLALDLALISPNVTGDIASIANLTKIKTLSLSTPKVTGDIASLANLSLLTIVNIEYNNNIKGDIVSLANKPIRNITFSGSPNISGDIASLANLTSLSVFYVLGTQIRGELVDFIISQRGNGRTTGSIRIQANGILTFNDKVLGGINTISWTASTITNETTSETVNR